jgi:hypothetical protein
MNGEPTSRVSVLAISDSTPMSVGIKLALAAVATMFESWGMTELRSGAGLEPYDIVVLCPYLTDDECCEAMAIFRRAPVGLTVVKLCDEPGDGRVEVTDGRAPDAAVDAVVEALGLSLVARDRTRSHA